MNGHQQIIAMRLAGKRPCAITVCDMADPDWHLYPNPWSRQFHAEVQINIKDDVKNLDMRFVVGLPAHVTFATMDRTVEVFWAAVKAGARPCVGYFNDGYDYFFEVSNG